MHASTASAAKRRAIWPYALAVLVLGATAAWIATRFWNTEDGSTEADATAIEVAIDKSPSAVGAILLGSHVDSSSSQDDPVEVSSRILPDERLYARTKEWREDGYAVELWITFVPGGTSTARALVHWEEDSGRTRGFVRNLHGVVRLTQDTPPPASSLGASDPPFVLEYELSGDQRGRPVTVRRKLTL